MVSFTVGTSSDIPAGGETRESNARPVQSEDAEAIPINEVHIITGSEQHASRTNREESTVTSGREEAEPNSFHEILEFEDDRMVDDLELPFFPVEKESPFMYLADLSSKWAAMKDTVSKVHGKIKVWSLFTLTLLYLESIFILS